jgi:predicted NAD-dependent protein-ADP-ribosyltransferase YbiA (DUF1768 family)
MVKFIGFSSKVWEWTQLSNFFLFLSKVVYLLPFGGTSDKFRSNEHYYVYCKICFFLSGAPKVSAINELWTKKTGSAAKKHGRAVIPSHVLDYFHAQWLQRKGLIMRIGLLNKALVCPQFQNALFRSKGSSLHEVTPGQNYWNCRGLDNLGIIMTEVRQAILNDSVKSDLALSLNHFETVYSSTHCQRKNRNKLLSRVYNGV